ncbi:copper resistance CopC family protein [Jeotgalibacillus marinus]|uniref:Copper resistance protein CopC n=1 Tax=Jeotgalibacillus marinus TaxID=86667 RepID=A0ABV3Q1F5_9BACL
MKKIIGLLVMISIFSVTPAYAHTGLDESTPADGETVTEAIEEISLQFNTVIEESSNIEIIRENGQVVETKTIEIDQNTLTAHFLDPLSNGTYDVAWDIIGEDGHQIQDVYSFTVEDPDQEVGIMNDPIIPEEESVENDSGDVPSSSTNTTMMPIVIVVLAAVAIGSTIFFLRRKKQ